MDLEECMRKHTHRSYVGWSRWLDKQWNKPSKTDHYLMQISAQIANFFRKSGTVNIGDQSLSFSFRKVEEVSPEEIQKQRMEQSKGVWKSAVGHKG